MAKPVDSSKLPTLLATYGQRATVITVGDDGRPHVGTSVVAVDGDRLRLTVGPSAARCLSHHPDLCLTWTPPAGENYQLILDVTASEVKESGDAFDVIATVYSGIRHRVAAAPGTGASCI